MLRCSVLVAGRYPGRGIGQVGRLQKWAEGQRSIRVVIRVCMVAAGVVLAGKPILWFCIKKKKAFGIKKKWYLSGD